MSNNKIHGITRDFRRMNMTLPFTSMCAFKIVLFLPERKELAYPSFHETKRETKVGVI